MCICISAKLICKLNFGAGSFITEIAHTQNCKNCCNSKLGGIKLQECEMTNLAPAVSFQLTVNKCSWLSSTYWNITYHCNFFYAICEERTAYIPDKFVIPHSGYQEIVINTVQ